MEASSGGDFTPLTPSQNGGIIYLFYFSRFAYFRNYPASLNLVQEWPHARLKAADPAGAVEAARFVARLAR